ncbi:MAG: hypothetical protein Q9184_003336 [Pyrenodesmia sp. 2 TL-2023]
MAEANISFLKGLLLYKRGEVFRALGVRGPEGKREEALIGHFAFIARQLDGLIARADRMSQDFRALEEEYTLLHKDRPEHVPPFVGGQLRFVTDAWIYVVKYMYEAELRVRGKAKL